MQQQRTPKASALRNVVDSMIPDRSPVRPMRRILCPGSSERCYAMDSHGRWFSRLGERSPWVRLEVANMMLQLRQERKAA